jgi:hypothetical protein
MQLLKSIGTFKDDKKCTDSAYQNSVTALIGREHNDDAVGHKDEIEDEVPNPDSDVLLSEVLSAVEKVSFSQVTSLSKLGNDTF